MEKIKGVIMTKEEFIETIKEFINNPIEDNPSGWPHVNEKDISSLFNIFLGIIEFHFPRDIDGDLPIEFEIIDRTKYEGNHFFKIPYLHKNDFDLYFDKVATNASIAINKLNFAIQQRNARKEEEKEN